MSTRRPRAMLALVLALGAAGFVTLAALLLLSPGEPPVPQEESLPLRSLAVAPFEARSEPTLAGAAARLGDALARALAQDMPQARVVAGRAADVRFRLEGDVRAADGDVELALTVIDSRDERAAGRAQVRFSRATLRDPDEAAREAASTARRLVTAAMLSAAAQ